MIYDVKINQVENGYIVSSKDKCTSLLEEHVFLTFEEAIRFVTYYFDEAEKLKGDVVNLVISNKKESKGPAIVQDPVSA